MTLYTIFDKLAKESGPLFEAVNGDVARRNFMNLIKENRLNPTEWSLYEIGKFEHDTMGVFIHDPILLEVENVA